MSRVIHDYRRLENNKRKYRMVKMMSREYCRPLANSHEWEGFHYHFSHGKYNGSRFNMFESDSRFLQCLKEKSKIVSVEYLCKMAYDNSDSRNNYCKDFGTANPDYPLPDPKVTDNLYNALKICLENEPVLGDSVTTDYSSYHSRQYYYPYQMDISALFKGTNLNPWKKWVGDSNDYSWFVRKFYTHDMMCMSDDPTKIQNYLECYNYESVDHERFFHDRFMNCIGLMNISVFEKQSLACNKGYVYPELGNIRDIQMRTKLSECLEDNMNEISTTSVPMFDCSNSEESMEYREMRTRVDSNWNITQPCFNKIFNKDMKYYDEILKKEMSLARYVCDYRFEDLTKFNISMMLKAKSAAKCFIDGPGGSDGKVKNCYEKVSKSLITKYDIDFLICIAPDEFINKV